MMIGNHTLKLALRGIPFNSLFPPKLLAPNARVEKAPILIILLLTMTIIVIAIEMLEVFP